MEWNARAVFLLRQSLHSCRVFESDVVWLQGARNFPLLSGKMVGRCLFKRNPFHNWCARRILGKNIKIPQSFEIFAELSYSLSFLFEHSMDRSEHDEIVRNDLGGIKLF